MQAHQSTNSPPTSAPPQSEPCETTVDAICPSHGAYVARVIAPAFDGLKPIKTGCPACVSERHAAEEARKQREAEAARGRRVAQLREESGIPARFSDRTFGGYTAKLPGQRIALSVCRAFAETWPEKQVSGASLVLTGGPGTGKTHLACAVANAVIDAYLVRARFGTVSMMLRAIKDTYRKDSERSEQDVIDRIAGFDLLVLDEVGVQVGSEHEKLLMFEVLNARYQDLRPTILISNLAGDELETFLGQRVMDRYRECGSVLAFDWPSHRGQS